MAFRVPLRPKVRLRALWAEDERLQPVIGRTLGTVECSPAPRPLIGVALESCAWIPSEVTNIRSHIETPTICLRR